VSVFSSARWPRTLGSIKTMGTGERKSSMRGVMADAEGIDHPTFDSLSEAQSDPRGTVVLEGDDGGQIYVVARASKVTCSEETLLQLLRDIDAREWPSNSPDMAHLCFEAKEIGEGVAGGMGGGLVQEHPWVHTRLKFLETAICDVLSGKRLRLVD